MFFWGVSSPLTPYPCPLYTLSEQLPHISFLTPKEKICVLLWNLFFFLRGWLGSPFTVERAKMRNSSIIKKRGARRIFRRKHTNVISALPNWKICPDKKKIQYRPRKKNKTAKYFSINSLRGDRRQGDIRVTCFSPQKGLHASGRIRSCVPSAHGLKKNNTKEKKKGGCNPIKSGRLIYLPRLFDEIRSERWGGVEKYKNPKKTRSNKKVWGVDWEGDKERRNNDDRLLPTRPPVLTFFSPPDHLRSCVYIHTHLDI